MICTVVVVFFAYLLLILLLPPLTAIENTSEGSLITPGSDSTQSKLASTTQLLMSESDILPGSNSLISDNDCSTGWYVEGYSFPIESDYDGKGYAQTIQIYSLNSTGNRNITTTIYNSEFLKNVQMKGWGITKQGDYIGSWDDHYWGPVSPSTPILGYPLIVRLTSETDESLLPYGEIFTIPTLPSPWNNTLFIALSRGGDVEGKQVKVYTGVGSAADEEGVKITGAENVVCIHEQAPKQECAIGALPLSTRIACNPNSIAAISNISIGDPAYDQFDSYIINATKKYNITDQMMIVKSMILQESDFNTSAISSDIPCGVPSDWTDEESRSFGLMQVTPACFDDSETPPNLTTDRNSPNWENSWFNPEYNINQGVKKLSENLLLMKSNYPRCSNEQYTLMAVGAYNSGEGAIRGCGEWNDRADEYITNVATHHRILLQIVDIQTRRDDSQSK